MASRFQITSIQAHNFAALNRPCYGLNMQFWQPILALLVLISAGFALPDPPKTGPTFQVADTDLPASPIFIVYGDMRFTNFRFPRNATSPWARRALAEKIAAEKPDALFLTGDVPYQGAELSDYHVFEHETSAWRDEHLRIYPALGNHEFYNRGYVANRERGLDNWWREFPTLKGMRWYSVELGRRTYAILLDSNFGALATGSAQRKWLDAQLSRLPDSVEYVLVLLHHGPISDYMEGHTRAPEPDSPPDDLDTYLERKQQHLHAHLLVIVGHLHNYGHIERNGVTYVVSGGGGAHPVLFHRRPDDQFKGKDLMRNGEPLPNYHYVKLELDPNRLKATMIRIADPRADRGRAQWQTADTFEIAAPHPQP